MNDAAGELTAKVQQGADRSLGLVTVRVAAGRVIAPGRDHLAEELAAIANAGAGVLVLGVDPTTQDVDGIELAHLDLVESLVIEALTESIEPPLEAHVTRMELPDSTGAMRAVIKVEVPRSLFVHRSPGGYFQRVSSSKRQLAPDRLARLFQQRSQARVIRFDEQWVPSTSPASLATPLWTRFLDEDAAANGRGEPGDPTPEALIALRKLRFVAQDDTGLDRATVAGLLLGSEHPEERLAHAQITAVRYRGVAQDSNYQLDAAAIGGPLDRQVASALAFVKRNMTVAATKDPGRREVPQFSERAVFEAIVNAVAHRDYSVYGSRIRLFVFDDRLELYSPGSLPNTLTIDSLALRQSTRNELITSLLARCPAEGLAIGRRYLMDRRGDGVPIIYKESRALGAPAPVYRLIDDTELLLTIWAAPLPRGEREGAQGRSFDDGGLDAAAGT